MTEASANTQPPFSDSDRAFIAEHGRLPRPSDHPVFNAYRRRHIETPRYLTLVQSICAFVLIPLRLFVFVSFSFFTYLIAVIFGPPCPKEQVLNFEPVFIPAWRRRILKWATMIEGRALLFTMGFWTVHGRDAPGYDHDEAQRATLVCNHSSIADPCLMGYLYGPSFVAKIHLYSVPCIGRLGASQHAFYIDRVNRKGPSVTEKIMERQRLVIQSKIPIPPVCIFPEGTTTNGEHLLKFRTGAFVAGTPIAVVLIRYNYKYFSPSYESIKTDKYLYGMLSQLANHVEYYRLPVYYPTEEEKNNPLVYANNLHQYMMEKSEEAFGTRLLPSEANYIDKLEYHSIIRGTKLKKGVRLTMD
eukprot:GFKZ01011033.1.p2 GENE.GFKZ01011033.1~~GFKZ01011033.1.p2  ORF type:complete len:358 (+),score=46.59 GFKZ01011033.1:41-1114(+)